MAKYDEKVKAECVEMVKQGVALAEITRQKGPNPKAIQRYCKKAGVDIPKAPKKEKAGVDIPKAPKKEKAEKAPKADKAPVKKQ